MDPTSLFALALAVAALLVALRAHARSRGAHDDARTPGAGSGVVLQSRTSDVVDGRYVRRDDHNNLKQDVVGLYDRLGALEAEIARLRSSDRGGSLPAYDPPPGPRGVDPGSWHGRSELPPERPAYGGSTASDRSHGEAPLPTPAGGQPVELRDGALVVSRSLTPVAVVVEESAGQGSLYLNDQVEIDHMALERWSAFFDFGGGEPYRRYATTYPASVSWDPAGGRGSLLQPGRARSI